MPPSRSAPAPGVRRVTGGTPTPGPATSGTSSFPTTPPGASPTTASPPSGSSPPCTTEHDDRRERDESNQQRREPQQWNAPDARDVATAVEGFDGPCPRPHGTVGGVGEGPRTHFTPTPGCAEPTVWNTHPVSRQPALEVAGPSPTPPAAPRRVK